ncbi:uncharacterized protein LOC108879674 [Lates calcarifer]|uniref:Uncharacterized protein LOC108879674 n=1 Tax=Lates calcarifer TaxID=8187 RepID=A0AAJ8B2S6_LATCA|nr:uncharacterized protein LOC108879674 [Lates calcarifer]
MKRQNTRCGVPIHLQDHNYFKIRRTSAHHRPSRNCCRDIEVRNSTPQPQHSASTSRLPQKRKRSSKPCPSAPPTEASGKLDPVPRPVSPISPADLPAVSTLPPRPQPSTADNQLTSTAVCPDSPLRIHNRSVEDYQKIYCDVVEDMLRYVCVKNFCHSFNQIIFTFIKLLKNLSCSVSLLFNFCFFHPSQIQEWPASSVQSGAWTSDQAEALGEPEPPYDFDVSQRRRTGACGCVIWGWSLSSPL